MSEAAARVKGFLALRVQLAQEPPLSLAAAAHQLCYTSTDPQGFSGLASLTCKVLDDCVDPPTLISRSLLSRLPQKW